MTKQLTLPQLQILIDRYQNTDSQQFEPNFLKDILVLRELELLDRQSKITPFGTQIIKGVELKLRLTEESTSIFKEDKIYNPYKGIEDPRDIRTIIKERTEEQRIEEREEHHD